MQTDKIIIKGQVQGVGFRPFIYRLAQQFKLTGKVTNISGEVEVICTGPEQSISAFIKAITEQSPPLAKPQVSSRRSIAFNHFDAFEITVSQKSTHADIHIPPDFFTCDDCLDEMSDPAQRRYRYPFTNCTQCGPRYTIIKSLPYDRPNTSMAEFPLCDECNAEYVNPIDRRFHAQPLACEKCGPELSFKKQNVVVNGNEAAIQACIESISQGDIVAIKGIGGYHLVCDALNAVAIEKLRERKHRPDKPLAIMFPFNPARPEADYNFYTETSATEIELINSPQRPIVLVDKKAQCNLPENIAPGLNQIGVFLPYSPLHHFLLNHWQGPLVATSGNISGEPVITDNKQAEHRLANVCDAFLQHNRPIVRPADDSVKRQMFNTTMLIRGGRGVAPVELAMQKKLKDPVIAVGGHLKATVALAWENRVIISPHISNLDTPRSLEVFQQVIDDLQSLYQVKAKQIVCDAHPGYQSTRWAKQQDLPVHEIYHHHAHAGVVAGQFPDIKNWLMFCWDGVGLGADGTLWGGETFFGKSGNWQHLAGFKPFYLPGGDKAGREPWRSASALRWETGDFSLPDINNSKLALEAWKKKINSPQSSAAGRLFDAASSMILGITHGSFEGQGPMQLEAIIEATPEANGESISLPIVKNQIDWQPLLPVLLDNSLSKSYRATLFHNSMAQSIIDQALQFKKQYDFDAIGLSGGVFQNRYLVNRIMTLANNHELTVCLPEQIPVNDGGLSYGQVIEYLHHE